MLLYSGWTTLPFLLHINCFRKKTTNFPSVFCLSLYCSKNSPSHSPSPTLSLLFTSSPFSSILSAHTSLHSGPHTVPAAGRYNTLNRALFWEALQTAGFHVHPLFSSLIDPPCFYTPSRSSLCPPLPGFPPASNSQSSAVPVCLYWGKKW